MQTIPDALENILSEGLAGDGRIVVLTGAGVSAESGIPTFRGEEGYWKVGGRNYHPQEMATRACFDRMPDEVWSWYLYRRGVCQAADPNAAHRALVDLESTFGDRFVLVTQNVDGLHLRAGNTLARTYQIHGNIDYMRCTPGCTDALFPLPDSIDANWPKTRKVEAAERSALVCPDCGALARPHVLWFDESYNEVHFKLDSSIAAAEAASLLIVVGTSGATTLPNHVVQIAVNREVPFVTVNLDGSPFTEAAERYPNGFFAQGGSVQWLVPIAERLSRA